MSYLVLARKYRPQTFEEIVGQEHVTRTLQSAIRLNRVAHAYMFSGSRGTGKTSIARIFAKAINCLKNREGTPCNECESCTEITRSAGVDVIELDAASNRGKEDAEQLRDSARFAPARGHYKIFIIDEAHMLTTEASNALLKVLEEPPPHVIFMFATTEAHKMLETIRSRCQRFQFRRLSVQQQVEQLKKVTASEGLKYDPEALKIIARESQGGMRDSLALVDLVTSSLGDPQKTVSAKDVTELLGLADRELLWKALASALKRDPRAALDVVETVYGYGLDVKDFHSNLLWMLRNTLVVKSIEKPEEVLDLTGDEIGRLRDLAGDLTLQHLDHLFQICQRAEDQLARSSHPRVVLEVTLVRMAALPDALAPEEIAAFAKSGGGKPPFSGGSGGGGARDSVGARQAPPPQSREPFRRAAPAGPGFAAADILNKRSDGSSWNASASAAPVAQSSTQPASQPASRPASPPATAREDSPERAPRSEAGDRLPAQQSRIASPRPPAKSAAFAEVARNEPVLEELIEVARPMELRIRDKHEE